MFNSRILNYVTHRIVTLTEFEKRLSGFFLSAIFYVNFWQKKSITINHEMQHKVNFLVCLLQNTSLSSHFCVTHKLLPVSTHSLIGGEFTLCVDEKQYICILNVGWMFQCLEMLRNREEAENKKNEKVNIYRNWRKKTILSASPRTATGWIWIEVLFFIGRGGSVTGLQTL